MFSELHIQQVAECRLDPRPWTPESKGIPDVTLVVTLTRGIQGMGTLGLEKALPESGSRLAQCFLGSHPWSMAIPTVAEKFRGNPVPIVSLSLLSTNFLTNLGRIGLLVNKAPKWSFGYFSFMVSSAKKHIFQGLTDTKKSNLRTSHPLFCVLQF